MNGQFSRTKKESINFYEVLGVSREATLQEIKKAYHHLSLQWHPDKSSIYSEKYFAVQEAYETLKDNNKRQLYDRNYTATSKPLEIAGRFLELENSENDRLKILIAFFLLLSAARISIEISESALQYIMDNSNRVTNNQFWYQMSMTSESLLGYASYFSAAMLPLWIAMAHDSLNALGISYAGLAIPLHTIYSSRYTDIRFFTPQLIGAAGIQNVPIAPMPMPKNSVNHEKFEEAGFTSNDIPSEKSHLICPLSAQIFTDPVYNETLGLPRVERAFIEHCIDKDGTNPYNRKKLAKSDLISDGSLKSEADDFIAYMISNSQKMNKGL